MKRAARRPRSSSHGHEDGRDDARGAPVCLPGAGPLTEQGLLATQRTAGNEATADVVASHVSVQRLRSAPPRVPDTDDLRRLGFVKHAGNHWQRDEPALGPFHVHVSVYTDRGRWDEFHVKFDDGESGRIFFFYDDLGAKLSRKSTPERRIEAIVRGLHPDLSPEEVDTRVDAIYREAADIRDWIVKRL